MSSVIWASIFSNYNAAGCGVVVRDSAGHFIAARNGLKTIPLDPLLFEVVAFKEALFWIKDMGHHMVVFESDSSVFVAGFESVEHDNSYFGLVLADCKLLYQSIVGARFDFVYRSANCVAHKLARSAISVSDRGVCG